MKTKLKKALGDKYFVSILVLFLIGVFLRFYRFPEFVTFLGDQGRDAIIVKRIITFEHFPAIGAPTSYGQVYLGPFYYYFMTPWLLLFNFNPLGLAFGVALISAIFIILSYLIVRELFDAKIALITSFYITFSTPLILLSRFSWNPNLAPVFSLLFIFFVIKAFKNGRKIFFILAGVFLALLIQLHYLALLLVPVLIYIMLRDRRKSSFTINNIFWLGTSFLVVNLPLVFFDIRHNFLNTRNFIKLYSISNGAKNNFAVNFFSAFFSLNKFSLNILTDKIYIIFSLIILYFIIKRVLKKDQLFIYLIIIIFGLSFYSGQMFFHYLGFLFPIYYICLAIFLKSLFNHEHGKKIIFTSLLFFVIINAKSYDFLYKKGFNRINSSKKIAQLIKNNVSSDQYRVTALPEKYAATPVIYFLELEKRKPIDQDSIEQGNEMFVLCESKCKPIGDPLYDIALFQASKIAAEWEIDRVKIYKLVR
ncbi:hypothetical protein A3H78_01335 [Candidatus Roizmanbacteria bacterium RIFCSPLOWO2_02_FULL_36_11]|uniref:Glycosyltransferase RgtA/B/C/D-like domain-containing protein n=1 Tax=Candidatus Roizmanbacteria bacterium RIFCSPLOWO2_02_FULL_36_11 TaxID=1802071 RepID=A0A1F7JFA6_9BACT|nr:MAG: hypothetical protein A3H78_01335 [Candidatus Roizmanbacteria bacterium RIFCSPLOWO2_02_FULL_36_11]